MEIPNVGVDIFSGLGNVFYFIQFLLLCTADGVPDGGGAHPQLPRRLRRAAGERGSSCARAKMRSLNSLILTGFGKLGTGGLPHPGCQGLGVRSVVHDPALLDFPHDHMVQGSGASSLASLGISKFPSAANSQPSHAS